MIVVNMFGGPGVGKSTVAAMLFAHYKRRGIRVEMARESAKQLFYEGRDLARNQVLITALTYQTLKDLEAAGTELVIGDIALRLNLVYAKALPFYQPLAALVRGMRAEFQNVDVLLRRAVPYQNHGRGQDLEGAKQIDAEVTGRFDVEIDAPTPLDVIAALDPIVLPLLAGGA